ncbi:MAG: CvpA family protein [Treponema sp.]|nr:CvpA family protein [Treponema sp.]
MTIVDLIMLGIIALFGIITAIRGFSKEIFAQAAWIFGVVAAAIFYKILFPYAYELIKIEVVAMIASFAVIFIVVFLVVKIVGAIVSKIFSGEILGSLDHTLGFVLGLLEGFIIVLVIVFVLRCQPWFDLSKIFEDSFLMEHVFSKIIPAMSDLMQRVEEKIPESNEKAAMLIMNGALA